MTLLNFTREQLPLGELEEKTNRYITNWYIIDTGNESL